MNFLLIIGIAVFIVVVFLLSKFILKTIIKAILMTITILFLASILLALFFIYDGYKTASMLQGTPVLLVSENGNITSGAMLGKENRTLSADELRHYSNVVTNGEKLNGTYILIADRSIVQDAADGGKQVDSTESLLSYYRSGKVTIYPETYTLALIHYLPNSLLKMLEGRAK